MLPNALFAGDSLSLPSCLSTGSVLVASDATFVFSFSFSFGSEGSGSEPAISLSDVSAAGTGTFSC
ncbi:hypothetical protein D3C77_583030 [compost metagenome]